MEKARFLTEPSRKVPIVREVDVLVVGGGMAGSCAAIAAGRMGLNTLLVEYFGCLGGNATTGFVNCFCGFFTETNFVQVVKGIGGDGDNLIINSIFKNTFFIVKVFIFNNDFVINIFSWNIHQGKIKGPFVR